MSDVKNIVIIGGNNAGHNLANSLLESSLPEDYRVIVVERNTYVCWAPGTVRQIVVPGWEEKNFQVEVTQEKFFPANSRHRLLCPNTVKELKRTSVVLEKPFEGSTELPFWKCIIATGAQQAPPIGVTPGSSIEEYKAGLRDMQAAFKKATKILIVGGGTVGCEVAGEITALYPNTPLTLVHDDADGLLAPTPHSQPQDEFYQAPTYPKLGRSLEQQLTARGVSIIRPDQVEMPKGLKSGLLPEMTTFKLTQSGMQVVADCVFISIGNRANSEIVKNADPGALSRVGARILVDDTFRVRPSSADSVMAGEYYSLGDVCANADWKTIVAIGNQAPALARVILADIAGRNPTRYKPTPQGAILVTLGPKGGSGVIPALGFQIPAPGFVMGMKSADFFAVKGFTSRFKGADKVAL